MRSRDLFVTGSDAVQYSLARDCIASLRRHAAHVPHDVAFLDLGCTPGQIAELTAGGCLVRPVSWEFGIQNHIPQIECRKGQICRPFLPEYFPDYDRFLWIDADAWAQDSHAIDLLLEAARSRGAGLVPEVERSSKFLHGGADAYLRGMAGLYRRVYGDAPPAALSHYVNLNAGVFCFHRDSHVWNVWKHSLHETLHAFLARKPPGDEIAAIFGLVDQIALNTGIRGHGLETAIEYLPLTCNWTCHLTLPAYDEGRRLLVEPYLPHEAIGIVHLTNPWGGDIAAIPHAHERRTWRRREPAAGKEFYRHCRLQTTDGGTVFGSLFFDGVGAFARSSDGPASPTAVSPADRTGVVGDAYDYVSPGLRTIWPDQAFPHMVEGDPDTCGWPWLRTRTPHRWCIDRRYPAIGFVSRDEAAILHTGALPFRGRRGLEIGCWQGWSACHIAAAGVKLDILDPILGNPTFRPTIEASFRRAGVIDTVFLHAASSPDAVATLAEANGEPWSFFFIDGDHEGDAVLNDTIACVAHAAADCLILFHDLVSPDVARGLEWLRSHGWHTRVYHTSQIMAAAWRGAVKPPDHTPDPRLVTVLGVPDHVRRLEQGL
jgi:hypothetical protein